MSGPILDAQGLTVPGRLEDATFELVRGTTVAVVGPSGSGKTTLLRIIAGFEAPVSGRLKIDGQLAASRGRVRIPAERRHVAFAFQDPALLPHLTVIGNVHLGLRKPLASRRKIAREALADVGLSGFSKRRVWELSGGEAQRVQLARVLAARARILLLDEPFASVDRMCRADLLARIGTRLKERAREGFTAIVTHDPADAIELADLTLVMRSGRVVAFGRYDQIAGGQFGTWPAEFLAAGLAGREIT
ncbi:MAG: ATP-binding cassette domain-containing protein [Chromatiaceae bacterium]|nr:ATP-binding cassette domain-containing protein [Chromatiaceae bacterium]MCP5422007.1 ATP-binding cassette domain-containing protein [Chromatiaceae bacterium]